MPLYELRDGNLSPIPRPGPGLPFTSTRSRRWYGATWAFVGDLPFSLTRKAKVAGGGIPGVVALDEYGRIGISSTWVVLRKP